MDIQFALSNDQLVTLLKAFSNWYEKDEREKKYAIKFRQKDVKLRKTLLNQEYLSKVSDDEFAQEIFEYSRTLEGPAHIRLGMPRITGELKNLKRNLNYLADSPEDPFKKAQEILEGKYRISIFAKAFWTPLFQAKYPDVLPNWNNKTETFFEKLGIKLKTGKLNIEEKYRLISEAFLYFQKLDPDQDFHNLNHLMHYGTVIDEGVSLIEKFLNPKSGGDFIPKNSMTQKIAEWRDEHVSEKRISARKKAESVARNLLSEKAGNFNENQLRQFFELINEDFWEGKIKHTRFGLAYTGHNINQIVRIDFFARYPIWEKLYSNRIICVALCQGAALHYIDGKNGVKDFDVWTFFSEHPSGRPFPYRRMGHLDFGESKFGRHPDDLKFKGRCVDLIGRSIKAPVNTDPVKTLHEYLKKGNTKTSRELSKKAVVILEPESLFGKVIWQLEKFFH